MPRLVHSGFFWWDVTFGDFHGLLLDDDTREATSRRVLDWLGWTLNSQEEEAFFVDATGRRHSLEAAHLLIQHTPEWQFDLYQMAMNFWR
ncbi:hypothetical protein [Deinococcus aetherius]|uniref:hypothetical protein n=1 Tax=Deinococcus aetherius TaxID=200252 RepID=UPI00222ED583|nr:hypothetical protein [Deinococcus aetherius]